MKELMIMVGNVENFSFFKYVLKSYEKKFGSFPELKFLSKGEILSNLEEIFNGFSFITIISSKENYPLIAKTLANLNDDLLEVRDETLLPSLCKIYEKHSFLINFKNIEINLLLANPLERLPKFLISKPKDSFKFFIFSEDEINSKMAELSQKYSVNLSISKYSDLIYIINATPSKFGNLRGFLTFISENFRAIFEESVAKFIVLKLKEKGLKISFAESVTAGLIASKIGEIAGASSVFDGSLITYSNDTKMAWLDVKFSSLELHSEYSLEVVKEMVAGWILRL